MRNIPQIPIEDKMFKYIKEVKIKSRLSWRDFLIKVIKFYDENKDKI